MTTIPDELSMYRLFFVVLYGIRYIIILVKQQGMLDSSV